MTEFRSLSPTMMVAGQIQIADLTEAKKRNVTLIVNNRPDGEEPDAPQSADIAAAASEHDMTYIYLPVTHSGISAPQIDSLLSELAANGGNTLGYCRSGTRSTMLWALAKAKSGTDPDDIATAAAAAGYDVAPIRPMIDMLAAQ